MPESFFSPLAAVNREHYAALLVLYYQLFQEYPHGLEWELVIREFMNYLALHRDTLAEEADDTDAPAPEADGENPAGEIRGIQEFDFGPPAEDSPQKTAGGRERVLANRFLRRLINAGWLGEEMLADFTRVINITAWGKPFMKALADMNGGLKTEYESHVVTVYSMLCGDSIKNDGHHAVLKAREEARSLIDSLKVLSQSIKGHYDNLNAEAIRSKAASALHEHYDLYMEKILDKAYKRLKTSDNVSRYRQSIFKQVSELLRDEEWLELSAVKYTRILQTGREECRKKLKFMLEEIRDDLKAVDPLEDEIDRRNAAYSRSSTEIIKAYIEPDSTIAGKLGLLIKTLHGGGGTARVSHGLYRVGFLSPSTVAFRRRHDESELRAVISNADFQALEQSEKEFFERMRQRLSIRKIGAWLDEQGGKDRALLPARLISGEESYIRFIYALLYGDSRNNFGYKIEDINAGQVRAAAYMVPDIRFRRTGSGEKA